MPTELPTERAVRAPGSMELDPTGDGLATDETARLISSLKVEGTAVFDRAGEALGTVASLMLDKVSGQIAYVVMASGGFLGLGESYHPLPWRALRYEPKLEGYVVDIDSAAIAAGPRLDGDEAFADAGFGRQVDAHYPVVPLP